MIDLPTYFTREAAIHRLPELMARKLARDAQMRSERTAKGNRARKRERMA